MFKVLPEKKRHKFVIFDIKGFYSVMKQSLSKRAEICQEKLHSSAYLKPHLSPDTLTSKIHLNSKIEEKNYLEKYGERKRPARHQLSRGN